MQSFIIEGGHPLSGTIIPQGAKNEALQVICATLLTSDPVILRNIPDILDVNNLIQLLRDIKVKVTRLSRNDYQFQADAVDLAYLSSDEFVRKCAALRGSVLMIGPLLSRFGKAVVAEPGGDKIGRRRLDTHFLGFKNLGAHFYFNEQRNVYEITASSLKGCYMLLDEASVTGTANIIMAAVFATCSSMRLRLRELPISSWRLSLPKAPPPSIMQLVSPIFSSFVICSIRWEPRFQASVPICSPSMVWQPCMAGSTACYLT